MCQTNAGQKWIPDFLKNLEGTSVSVPDNTPRKTDVTTPLEADDYSIQRRKEALRKQYETNPGSIQPIGLTRKQIMDELT